MLRIAELVQRLAGTRTPIEHQADRPGDVRRHVAGVQRARSMLGFSATVGIDEGLSRCIEWVRSEPLRGVSAPEEEEARNWQFASASV